MAVVGCSWAGLPYFFIFIFILVSLVTGAENFRTQPCYVLVTLYVTARMVPYSLVCRRWEREGGGR
ncbi:hypothetical protein LX36DRAFT_660974 [Colletotrichum falcatum]|nr:hypothetical protein LX36DRAFT_660974 [Colletotrichum falcatum]